MAADAGMPAALGFRAIRGGAVVVGLAFEGEAPRVVLSSFLATAAEGDRLAFEPYHLAVDMAQGRPDEDYRTDLEAVIAEGRRRQDTLAAQGLDAILGQVREAGCGSIKAALLLNRAGWLTDDLRLEHSLSAPEHPPVIEGLAVRDALRFAFDRHAVPVTEMDEKSLPELASAVLGLTPEGLDAELKALGASAGRPWRKEQKLACLAARLALAC